MRAVSTVLDVALFLLLVGGAVAAVTAPIPSVAAPLDTQQAANTAGILTTSTATVSYTLRAPPSLLASAGPEFDRHAHGTLARLLAAGALSGLAVDDEQVSHARDGYRQVVANATLTAVRRPHQGVQVRTAWRPYGESSIEGRQVVGAGPPDGVAVQSVTVRVPSGFPSASERARVAAREEGYAGVASVAASAVVEGLFPRNITRHALAADVPVNALVRHRYRRLGQQLGISIAPTTPAAVDRVNTRLERRLAQRFERNMRSAYGSPAQAARAVSTGAVRITVRVWEP